MIGKVSLDGSGAALGQSLVMLNRTEAARVPADDE
jgi:hypothetical protein